MNWFIAGFAVIALILCTIALVLNIQSGNTTMAIVMIGCIVMNLINIGFQLIK